MILHVNLYKKNFKASIKEESLKNLLFMGIIQSWALPLQVAVIRYSLLSE
jgi:hypothetical protein